ncbi:MAG: IS200/IS605 family transposase [Actinomycetota bacterium]
MRDSAPKERQKLIAEDFQPRLWKYVTGICQNIDLIPVAVGGMPDHLHLLFHLPPSRSLADAMRAIKTWRERIESRCCGQIHPFTEGTSPQDDL